MTKATVYNRLLKEDRQRAIALATDYNKKITRSWWLNRVKSQNNSRKHNIFEQLLTRLV